MSPRTSLTGREESEQRILAIVDSIPRGRVATYGQVAQEAGLPRRARLVGHVLSHLPARTQIPWQRVLGAGGQVRPRPGARRQVQRLRGEGVEVSSRGRVDLGRFAWRPDW